MSTKLEAFPFLIGRSYNIDYKVIVTPDFMSKSTELLSRVTGDIYETENDYLVSRQVYTDNIEPFTVIFQVKKAKIIFIDSSYSEEDKSRMKTTNTDFLEDKFGREIYLVEGLVMKTIDQETFNISRKLFEEIHNNLLKYFKAFWEGDVETKIIDSIVDINSDAGEYLIIKKLKPLNLRDSEPKHNQLKLTKKYIVFLVILLSIFYIFYPRPKWEFLGIDRATGKEIFVDNNSIRKSGGNIRFTLKIGNKSISSNVKCDRRHTPGRLPFESNNLSKESLWQIRNYVCKLWGEK